MRTYRNYNAYIWHLEKRVIAIRNALITYRTSEKKNRNRKRARKHSNSVNRDGWQHSPANTRDIQNRTTQSDFTFMNPRPVLRPAQVTNRANFEKLLEMDGCGSHFATEARRRLTTTGHTMPGQLLPLSLAAYPHRLRVPPPSRRRL